MYTDEIKKISDEIAGELVKIRRTIHEHPELGHHEEKTAALVAEKLQAIGLEVTTHVGLTGVVGLLKGCFPGRTILLRADMDCLSIEELNAVPYKSRIPGLMHACGHDAHTAWLLRSSMMLARFKEHLCGNVKFVFQPAEESPDGANSMIRDGVLENPRVDAAIGAHVSPDLAAGKIGVRFGEAMASPGFFKIVIHGKGGHGSQPSKCIDPLRLAHQVYDALQLLPITRVDAVESLVITVTRFTAGNANNIIPNHAEMEGTVRVFSPEIREKLSAMMDEAIKNVVEPNGGTYEFQYRSNTPAVINEVKMTALVEAAAAKIVGATDVERIAKPSMNGEDFSCFQQHVPATFFFVGNYNEAKNTTRCLHHPEFDIDEDILPISSAVMACAAIDYLGLAD